MLRGILQRVVFGAVCVAAASAVAEEGVMFAHHFETGASQRYRVRFNGEADLHGMIMTQTGDMEVTVKCDSTAAGKHSIVMTFDKVEMSRSMGGNLSSDPRGNQLAGHAVTFDVDDKGNASNIKTVGYVEAWNELRSAIEPIVKGWYVYLPGKNVAVGGEWSEDNAKETESTGIEVTTNSRFKFKEMKKVGARECAFVSATVENTFAGKSANPTGEVQVDGKGKGKYEFCFDPAAGVVVSYKGKMDVEMEMVPVKSQGEPIQSTVGYQFERELL